MDLVPQITERAERAGVPVAPALAAALASYLELLERWNRKINLTALTIDPPTDEAIDRLVVEPLVAAERVRVTDGLLIDIGSGGGSPAIPMKLAVPALGLVMVEMKARKTAFLREAVRHLGMADVVVENCALAELVGRAGQSGIADVVTVRAVRMDGALVRGIQALLRPGGRLFWFRGAGEGADSLQASSHLVQGASEELGLPGGGVMSVFVNSLTI
jgi:16S rRNA (guanine527-N7)-methyltransferase